MWIWLSIGASAFFSASIVAGVAVTAALREIARRTSGLMDEEAWTTAPPTRAMSGLRDDASRWTSVAKRPSTSG